MVFFVNLIDISVISVFQRFPNDQLIVLCETPRNSIPKSKPRAAPSQPADNGGSAERGTEKPRAACPKFVLDFSN